MCRLGDIAGGLISEEKGERDWRATGAVLHATRWHSMLAESYLLAGDLAAAGAHLTAARAHRESHGENYMAAEIYRLAPLLSQAEGASSEVAEHHLNEALRIAREQAARLPSFAARQCWQSSGASRTGGRKRAIFSPPSMAGSPRVLILPIYRRQRACSTHWYELEVGSGRPNSRAATGGTGSGRERRRLNITSEGDLKCPVVERAPPAAAAPANSTKVPAAAVPVSTVAHSNSLPIYSLLPENRSRRMLL